MTPSRFTARSRKGARRAGAAISYLDSKMARSSFTVLKRQAGIRRGGRCVRPKSSHTARHSAGCLLYVVIGRFKHSDRIGLNRFHFSGQVGGRTLSPGFYLLNATATFGGQTGRTASTAFRIVS
jgi:hypothetical protein